MLNLAVKNYCRIAATSAVVSLVLISCESKFTEHSHPSLTQPLIDCKHLVLASIQINKSISGEKRTAKKDTFEFNESMSPESVFKTLCFAKVERIFKVSLNELEEYRLAKHFDAELIFKFSDNRSIKIDFGRATPDGFGQYVRISSLPSFTNLFNPIVEVLVLPAYHLKLLEKSRLKSNYSN